MSKSEMIKGLQSLKKRIYLHYQDLWQYEEMLDEAIAAIEVSEDCISRAWLEQEIERERLSDTEPDIHYGWNIALDKVVEIIKNAPSVVPNCSEKPNNCDGEWKFKKTFPNDDSEFPMGYLVCSVCGSQHANATPCNYCDNCGAKMKGVYDE